MLRAFVVVVSFLVLLATGCGRESSDAVLRVGTSGEYPPFTFLEGGALKGIEIDLAQRFAEESGRKIELVQLPLVDLIPALAADRIDVIMAGFSETSERRESVRFTQPYLQVGQMALIRRSELELRSAQGLIDTPETRVGFRSGTTGEQFVRSTLKSAQLRPFSEIEDGIAALRAEQIDYFVHDAPTIWRIVGGFDSSESQLTGLYRPLTDEYIGWAVRQDDAALAEQLDASLARWQENGDLELLLDTWIRVRRVVKD